jgi:hypothetical protein
VAESEMIVGRGRAMTEEERDERLERIERMLSVLVERQTVKDFYTIDEFVILSRKSAPLLSVGRAPE